MYLHTTNYNPKYYCTGKQHGKQKRKTSECLFGGREVSSRMCLLGATLDIQCSVVGAAVVGATVVGAATVGLAVVGAAAVGSAVVSAAEVGVTSGVLYGAVISA